MLARARDFGEAVIRKNTDFRAAACSNVTPPTFFMSVRTFRDVFGDQKGTDTLHDSAAAASTSWSHV